LLVTLVRAAIPQHRCCPNYDTRGAELGHLVAIETMHRWPTEKTFREKQAS
jgi:hypothetical protein